MERASGGDVKALMELMQHTNRNAYAAALDHGTKLTDTYMGRRVSTIKAQCKVVLKPPSRSGSGKSG